MAQQYRKNEEIRRKDVRVIDKDGENKGVMPKAEAIELAREQGLDLVEINPSAQPPVAKVLDYGKFMYEKQKEEKKQRSQQKTNEIKQVQIKYQTSDHDLDTKARQIDKFLNEGYKVKADIYLRGREKAHRDLARERLETFIKERVETPFRTLDKIRRTPRGFVTTIVKE